MNRLDFVLPDFTRVSWNDVNVRKIWEPRISKINEVWRVVETMRGTSLQFILPELLPDLVSEMAKHGKIVIPLDKEGVTNTYSSSSVPYRNGEKFQYRVVITNDFESVNKWNEAWKNHDSVIIGSLLNYPSCCIDFFKKYWVDEKFVDTTWMMIVGDGTQAINGHTFSGLPLSPENNILLRWLGLRLVSHLPCSFWCEATKKIAEFNKEKFRTLNFNEELAWLEELLSYEITWSGLHGIAEIVTPILKITARTDSTGEKYTVKLKGVIPSVIKEKKPLDIWTDNGFNSLEDMTKAHDELLIVSGLKDNRDKLKVLDLGCGNGVLLSKIPNIIPCGIDLSPSKILKARTLLPDGLFHVGSIYDFNWITDAIFDYVFLAGNRLHENPLSGTLVRKLKDFSHNVILYSYDRQHVESFYSQFFYEWKIIHSSFNAMILQP